MYFAVFKKRSKQQGEVVAEDENLASFLLGERASANGRSIKVYNYNFQGLKEVDDSIPDCETTILMQVLNQQT